MERLLWLKDFVILSLVCIHLTMAIGLPPNVNAPNYITVMEDVPIGSIIGSLTAFDSSGVGHVNVVTRSYVVRIENSTTPGNWSIILNTNLDRETTTSYILSFTADNCGLFPLTFAMTMFVQDVNDVHPMFENLPYNIDLKEDTPSGQIVYTNISASDPDDGIGGNVSYYMQDMTQHPAVSSDARFSIDVNNGNVIFTGQLDYETIKFYHYKVIAVDGGNLSSTTDLFINVTDVQDTAPYFSGLPYMFWLEENTQSGTPVYKVNAFDGDTGVPNNVTYSFASADPVNCSSFFGIDNATGEIIVTSNSLDRDRPPFLEKNGICEIIVQAVEISTDPGPRLNDKANCTLTITVIDVNDNVPTFSNNIFTATITENSGPGTPLTLESGIQLSVSDADQGANSDFSLGLSSYNSCLIITPTNVRGSANINLFVSNRSCFDFEVLETMTFRIIATESTTGTFSNVTITLMILNENDNDPTFNQTSYNGSVVENVKDRLILQVHAFDKDAGMFGSISYSLEGDCDRFTINNETGEFTTKDDNLDRETKDTYLLTVVATDGGGRRSGVPLAITVTDANDETPTFLYSYASRIAEGSLQLAPNLTLQANDNDQQGSENSHVIYRIANCKPNVCSNFALDGNSGLLAVNSPLDYENLVGVEGVITITVWAIDNGTPQLTGNTSVQITVEDLNDVQPVFSSQTYTANVLENAPSGQSVTQVSTSDGDGSAPNNVVFYVLESGGSDNFRLNSTAGVITVGPGAMLDRETVASYSLIVLAIDRGYPPLSSTTTVSISLDDVNDEPPTFIEQMYEFSVYENASVGDVIFTVTADDPDTNHDLVYSLLLNESQAFTDRYASVDSSIFQSWFDISSNTGSIRVASPIDREIAEIVILRIAVRDRNGTSNLPQTTQTTLRIILLDVNDNEPVITPFGVLNVSSALTVGTEVTTLTAMSHEKDLIDSFITDPTSVFQTTSDVETTTSAAEVTTSHGHHDITCTESRMEFSIPLSSPHTSETATLSDPNCQINVTRTHVRGGVDLNSCGTTVQFQNDSVIFRNAIIFSAPESSSLGSSGSNGSVSQYQDIIPIQCVYNRIATVHLSYMPVVRRVLFTESGVGQFSFNIQQFWDASFTNMVSDRAYPLRMELDADVFIQLSVGSEGQPVAGHKEIGMEVQQCLVSPSSSVIEAQLHYYPLIQDGCPASSDVHIIPNTNASDSTVMRFRFRAVNFFDPSSSSSSSLVFVHCRMGLCLTGSCKPSAWSCLTPPARRVRRDVDQSKRAAHQLSTGPFLIMADEASTSSSSTTATVMAVVSTSVATVAIVIAAIALIALRRRRTTARN